MNDNEKAGYRRSDETESERLDRNWSEILQELRVAQTGTQILTGFLLTIAFQPRFVDLDGFQVTTYLVLVALAAAATALGLTPVSLHRLLFQRGMKDRVVRVSDRLLRLTLIVIGILLAVVVLFIFDVVVGRAAGLIAGGCTAVVAVIAWFLVPRGERIAGR